MSRYSGRQTDSHGLARKDDGKGNMIPEEPHRVLGTPKNHGNKGVESARRAARSGE